MSRRPTKAGQPPWHSPPEAWDAVKPLAREMRHGPTPAEQMLWDHLHARRFAGFRFRRQHALDWFVVDFYCPKARLVIELDGAGHDTQREQDAWRDATLAGMGLRVLRFGNDEVLASLPEVLRQIAEELKKA